MVSKIKMLIAAFGLLLSFSNCHNHGEEPNYVVNIAILKPTANQTIALGATLPIEVTLTRADNGTIHNGKFEILDSATGATVETLLTKHYHVNGSATYSESNYKPTAKGSFKLRVTVTDDDGNQPNTAETAFTVN